MADERKGDQAGAGNPELPAYESASGEGPQGRPTVWFASCVAVVAVLAGAVWAMAPRHPSGRRTEEPTTTSPSPTTAPADPSGAQTIGALSPTDGKASKRLHVRLTPDTDLVDGQVVGIHGSGFTPGRQVGIVTCTNAAQKHGVDACDTSTYALSTVDRKGEVQGLFTVRRFITVAGQVVDCMNGTVDPEAWAPLVAANGDRPPDYPSFTCIGVIGELDDYDNSGGWPFALRGAVFQPLQPPPGPMPGGTASTTTSIAPSPTVTGVAPAPPPDGKACPYPDPTFPTTTTASSTPTGSAPASTKAPSSTVPASPSTTADVGCDPTIV